MPEPIMIQTPGRMRDIEQLAADAYRQRYPDGIPWVELHTDTRFIWINTLEKKMKGGAA